MSNLTTDLSASPYWDDYKKDKQFYKILFVPKRAVQVREMNQIQTMIQQQVSRFADHQFKDGSIVSGCNITYFSKLDYVRCSVFVDGSTTVTNTQINQTIENYLVVSRTTGLRASVRMANPGYVGTYPDTNIIYVDYLNKGRDKGGVEVSVFQSNEILDIYNQQQDKFGQLNPGYLYNSIYTLNPTRDQVTTGLAYAVKVDDGIVYQKGYFVYVKQHTILVKKYDQDVSDYLVGFETREQIIKPTMDNSLVDPVDTSNRNGIGADRLKLIPVLTAKKRSEITTDSDFFPIIEFGKDKLPVKQNTDPEYAKLGDVLAKRTYENSGDYYVNPFIVSTKESANTELFTYVVSPGIGYVKGNRVELVGALDIDAKRSTDVGFRNANAVTLNYGNYVYVNQLSGVFRSDKLVSIDIYDKPQQSISLKTNTSNLLGAKVGVANVRVVVFDRGTKGDKNCTYRFYITNIIMDANKSFVNDAKSFVSKGSDKTSNAICDIVVESDGKAALKDSGNSSLIFDIGVDGAKRLRDSNGTNDTQFTFRETSTATLQANGSVTFTVNTPHAGGNHRFFASPGVLSTSNKEKINIATTAPMTGYQTGINLDLSLPNVTVTAVSNTQFIVNLGHSIDSGAPQTLVANYPVVRTEANEIKKQVVRGTYVKIDCNTTTENGSYNLGLVDVFNVSNIWVGDSFSENNPDRIAWFSIDNGQQLTHYDHSRLVIKPQYRNKISKDTKILVKLDHFVANTATGIGFFSVDSYPTRGPGDVESETTISYEDIPEVQGINLRNCVDFRPQKINTAAIAKDPDSATINPRTADTEFNINSSGTYIGEPDADFQADIEYYLPRIDLIQVNKDGKFNVKSSIATEKPITPTPDEDSMPVATAYVPPFPALTSTEVSSHIQSKPRIRPTLVGNRVYTMKDINSLDKRITTLEYYQTLSMLETKAKDYTVKDENGLDRFKNGIFADPLKNHLLGDVSNFEYNIAIDEDLEIARPRIKRSNIDLDISSNTNVQTDGRVATLGFTSVDFITQPYASKYRNVTESVWNWAGSITLFPEFDHYRDEKKLPDVNTDIDLASPWQEFANTPFGQMYGDWRVSGVDTKTDVSETTMMRLAIEHKTTTTTTTTTTTSQRVNRKIGVGTSQTKQNLGSYTTDVSMSPYIRGRNVAFVVNGLRPNTRMYAFFDGESVTNDCAPGVPDPSKYDVATGKISYTNGKEDEIITRTGDFGSPLVTNDQGSLYGIFRIPDQKFKTGDRVFKLCDVDDLKVGKDAILTSASAMYTASSLTTTSRGININTTNPKVSSIDTTETKVESATSITQKHTTRNLDPLGQSFKVTVEGPGVFLSKIGGFFRSRSETLGITCYVTEMLAGVPDNTRVVGSSYLKPSEVNISSNGSAETIFTFDDMPYLTNDKSYAFFFKPDGDSPDYTIWMSEVGGQDVLTSVKIFSNPYTGVAFKSSNSESWDILSTEDVKFNIYRCNFDNHEGEVVFTEQDDDYFTITGLSYFAEGESVKTGDIVYKVDASGNPILTDGSPRGIIQSVDSIADQITLDSSTGGFHPGDTIKIYRPSDTSSTNAISDKSLIAVTTIVSVDDIDYSTIVPQITTTTPSGTSVHYSYRGSDRVGIADNTWYDVQPENELELIDKVRVIKSKSNRTDKTTFIRIKMVTDNDYITPIINLRRRSLMVIDNIVNNDIENEQTRYGNALTKYLSKPFTLAEGQDAEDVKVFVTGYRPADTDIHVYAKIMAADDSDNFYDKYWTKLDMVEGLSVRSSSIDTNDFREFGYEFPTSAAITGTAYKNLSNKGVVQYINNAGTVFVGYKQIAFKIVLTSSAKQRVPRVDDIRAICLQI